MSRSLVASGLAGLLIVTLATPAQAAKSPQANCMVPESTVSTLDTDTDDAGADERRRAVQREVAASFGLGRGKERIAEQLRRGYIGHAVDPVSGSGTVVVTPEYRGSRQLAQSRVITGCHTAKALIEADDLLTSRSWHPDAGKASFGFSLQAGDSRFHVSFDARYPAAAFALRAKLGDRVVVTLGQSSRTGRLNDGEPHFGGAGIRDGYGSMYSNVCTSAFSVRINATGQRGSVTAGHCFGNYRHIYSGPQYYGKTGERINFPTYDMIVMTPEGETYDNVIHTDACCPVKRDVVGYQYVAKDSLVCFSGMTSKAICNIMVTSINAFFCDSWGCTGNLISATKGGQIVVRNGDSGAPIYTRYGSNGALGVGMLIATTDGGTIGYGEHLGWVENHLGVSLLTW